jgi:hypothetical protein
MARGLEAQTFRGMTANAATQEPKKNLVTEVLAQAILESNATLEAFK